MKVKVLHVFEYFSQGGIENFVMNVFRNIDREKYEFYFAFINRTKGYFDDEAKKLGGKICYFASEEKSFSNYKQSLSQIIKEFGPFDVIHSHMYYFSGYILKVAKKNGVPIRIAHSHETTKGRKTTLLRRMYETYMRSLILKNANRLVSCSNIAGECLFGKNKNCITLYNGIDTDRFSFNTEARETIRKNLGVNEDCKLLLNIGRLSDQKNQLFIVDIFNEYLKKDNNSKLILVGEGSLDIEIKDKIKKYGIEEKVILTGSLFNTEDYYSACDCFVMPSKYEGLGIVAVEAQASGLPTVASTEVPNEVASTNLMEFVNLNDPIELWCKKILEAVNKKNDRKSYTNKIKGTPFDIHETVKLLCKVYDGEIVK